MSVIRLTKEFKFEMAHALNGYNGPCRHIHGHSYELLVTVSGKPVVDPDSPVYGMVMDFTELKAIVKDRIVSEFDHSLVLHRATVPHNLNGFGDLMGRLVLVDYPPTSENLLSDFAGRISESLPDGVRLHSLKLRETMTSYAEWYASDNVGE